VIGAETAQKRALTAADQYELCGSVVSGVALQSEDRRFDPPAPDADVSLGETRHPKIARVGWWVCVGMLVNRWHLSPSHQCVNGWMMTGSVNVLCVVRRLEKGPVTIICRRESKVAVYVDVARIVFSCEVCFFVHLLLRWCTSIISVAYEHEVKVCVCEPWS